MKLARGTIFVTLAVLAACQGGGSESFPQPRYGEDACAECGSTIRDPNFAAAYRAAPDRQKLFDDPGCLFRALRADSGHVTGLFFHEYEGTRWIGPDEVFFAKTPKTESPQGYGWAAYGSFGDAQTAVTSAGAGKLLTFAQAKDAIAAETP